MEREMAVVSIRMAMYLAKAHWKNMDCDLDVDNNGSVNSSINQIKGFLQEL